MSIAEQIMMGTQQQEKSWSVLAKNLGDLGRDVGNQLALQQYQKQAAEALPAMQAAYRSAMDDVSRGSVSEGYKKFIDAQFQFGGSQNPFISNQNKLVSEIFMEGAAAYEKQQQRKAQYGGEVGGLPAVNASKYGFRNTAGNDSEPAVVTNPNQMQPQNQSGMDAIMNPEGTPIEGGLPQRQGVDASKEPDLSAKEPAMTRKGAQPQATPAVVAGRKNFQNVTSLPVNEQRNAAMSYGVSEVNPEQYEVVKIAGLKKYFPEYEGHAVPKESWKETSASRSGKGDVSVYTKFTAPEARDNFTKRSSNPEERGTKQNVEAAIESMKDKTMDSLFNDYGQDIFALRAATDSKADPRNQNPIFTVTTKDGKDKRITRDQYLAIQTISGIVPATSENAGGTPAIFRPKKKTQDQLIDQAFMELGPNATDEQIAQRVKQLSN